LYICIVTILLPFVVNKAYHNIISTSSVIVLILHFYRLTLC